MALCLASPSLLFSTRATPPLSLSYTTLSPFCHPKWSSGMRAAIPRQEAGDSVSFSLGQLDQIPWELVVSGLVLVSLLQGSNLFWVISRATASGGPPKGSGKAGAACSSSLSQCWHQVWLQMHEQQLALLSIHCVLGVPFTCICNQLEASPFSYGIKVQTTEGWKCWGEVREQRCCFLWASQDGLQNGQVWI